MDKLSVDQHMIDDPPEWAVIEGAVMLLSDADALRILKNVMVYSAGNRNEAMFEDRHLRASYMRGFRNFGIEFTMRGE